MSESSTIAIVGREQLDTVIRDTESAARELIESEKRNATLQRDLAQARAEAKVNGDEAADLRRELGEAHVRIGGLNGRLHEVATLCATVEQERDQLKSCERSMRAALDHCLLVFKSMANRGRYPLELLPENNDGPGGNVYYLGKQGLKFITDALAGQPTPQPDPEFQPLDTEGRPLPKTEHVAGCDCHERWAVLGDGSSPPPCAPAPKLPGPWTCECGQLNSSWGTECGRCDRLPPAPKPLDKVTTMALCEVAHIVLHTDQLYRFVAMPGCDACAELAKATPAPKPQCQHDLCEPDPTLKLIEGQCDYTLVECTVCWQRWTNPVKVVDETPAPKSGGMV